MRLLFPWCHATASLSRMRLRPPLLLHTHLRPGYPSVPPLAKEVGGRKVPTPLPFQKRPFLPLGEWCFPCRRRLGRRLEEVAKAVGGGSCQF